MIQKLCCRTEVNEMTCGNDIYQTNCELRRTDLGDASPLILGESVSTTSRASIAKPTCATNHKIKKCKYQRTDPAQDLGRGAGVESQRKGLMTWTVS